MRLQRFVYGLIAFGLLCSQLYAGRLTVHIGPPAVGNGGTNPVSIPPLNPIDYGFVYLTDSRSEWTLSISPGLFYGHRKWFGETYVSAGGGLMINANGAGPAFYTAFGYDHCATMMCFNMEYKQAIGLSAVGPNSAYALRMGVSFDW